MLFWLSFILSYTIIKVLIPILSKSAKQPIYEEGPKWHSVKYGTPTMGGIAFIFATTATSLISATLLFQKNDISRISIPFSIAFALCNALIGIIDDVTKLKHHKNAGLSPKQKIVLQSLFAVLFLAGRSFLFDDNKSINLGTHTVNLGVMYYPLAFILILGIINCANLTDGLDGLGGSTAFVILIAMFCFSLTSGNASTLLSIIAAGAVLGFLTQNIHPARIFMGDTGSLFLGALVVAIGFDMMALPTTVVTSGVYVIEGISVIMQVACYKLTRKRIFKMAPIHHHFEKSGLDEGTICVMAILVSCVCALLGYSLLPI